MFFDRCTNEQKIAIIRSVDALAELAGEGFCVAEDAIFDLHNSFGGDGSLEYGEWIRLLIPVPGGTNAPSA